MKEELENKQLEYMKKLDIIHFMTNRTEQEEILEKQLESDLDEIESALQTIHGIVKSMSTGLNLNKK